jgi:hypothetical protein
VHLLVFSWKIETEMHGATMKIIICTSSFSVWKYKHVDCAKLEIYRQLMGKRYRYWWKYAYNKDTTRLYLADGGVTATAVRCDVRESHDSNTAALLRRPRLSKTHENKKLCCISANNKRCSVCSVYSVHSVVIVPTGSLRLPWLRFIRAFSSSCRANARA